MSEQQQSALSGAHKPLSAQHDVAILGGGIAGQTLALQLRQMQPGLDIIVLEKQAHPVPEAAHKVGESTVEIAAHYLRDVLGLGKHLQNCELRKFGLRFFFSAQDNQDITRRVELGHALPPPRAVESYQLDRGRLENALGQELEERGITFLSGCRVQQIELRPHSETHRVRIQDQGGERELLARWVVDASGRSSLLKRQLGLAKKTEHHANAAWFRLSENIDLNTWSDDAAWQARIGEGGQRYLSTNHLMGPGYWVWLIPLGSGSISVGIVADAQLHPFEEINRFERAMDWLRRYEPQCAREVELRLETLQDFRVMKDYCYSSEQVYSGDRWCLTGEAGVFLDPFYSPGSDMISISNGLICDLITSGLAGEELNDLAATHNQLYLMLNDSWRSTYEYQYPIMGNAQVMSAKIIWDTAAYWAAPALLYYHDTFRTFADTPAIALNLLHFSLLSKHIQAFFRQWHAIDQRPATDAFIRYYDFDFMPTLQIGLVANLSARDLEVQFRANIRLLDRLAGQLVSLVSAELSTRSGEEAVGRQLAAWQAEPFLNELVTLYQQDQEREPLASGWLTLGGRSWEKQEVMR
ncbi:MAG TPA: NAD(P)/FAD-dependent oxidoreductase [Ktedonobacteraceae bacterium]|jgi:flavin-dependent dehydrogenase